VQVNIKSIEANGLIDRLTQLTGESKTRAITESLRLRLAALEREADTQKRIADVNRLVDDLRSRLPRNLPTQAELDAWIYDPDGLPR
jgi:hypothetical protein